METLLLLINVDTITASLTLPVSAPLMSELIVGECETAKIVIEGSLRH